MAGTESAKSLIIEKAFELFNEKGYENVKVQDICEACNLTRGAFYYHYKTKDAILDDIFYSSNNIPMDVFQNIINVDNYIDQFYALFATYLDKVIATGPNVTGEVYKRYISNNVKYLFYPKDFPAFPMYVDLIRKAQEAGQIGSASDPEVLAETAAYVSDGIGLVWCSKNGEIDFMSEFRRIMDGIFIRK